jgi:hypothetical protein
MGAQAREAVGGDAVGDSVVTKVDHIVVPSKDVWLVTVSGGGHALMTHAATSWKRPEMARMRVVHHKVAL